MSLLPLCHSKPLFQKPGSHSQQPCFSFTAICRDQRLPENVSNVSRKELHFDNGDGEIETTGGTGNRNGPQYFPPDSYLFYPDWFWLLFLFSPSVFLARTFVFSYLQQTRNKDSSKQDNNLPCPAPRFRRFPRLFLRSSCISAQKIFLVTHLPPYFVNIHCPRTLSPFIQSSIISSLILPAHRSSKSTLQNAQYRQPVHRRRGLRLAVQPPRIHR